MGKAKPALAQYLNPHSNFSLVPSLNSHSNFSPVNYNWAILLERENYNDSINKNTSCLESDKRVSFPC